MHTSETGEAYSLDKEPPDKQPSDKEPQFGLAITTSMTVGVMIGSGIFLLPASLASFGAWSFYGWLLSAVGALSIGWVFAKLSDWHPGLGGPYHFTRVGVGEFPAFFVAWGYWVSVWVGNAAIAMACASYLSMLMPSWFVPIWSKPLLATVMVWLFTFINTSGVNNAGKMQLLTTILKAAPLLIFGLAGIWYVDMDVLHAAPTTELGFGEAILASTAIWLWAFLGVESASIPADNIKNPKVTIARATLIGVILVASIYLLGALVVFGTLTQTELAESSGPFAQAAEVIWGDWAKLLVIFVAVVSSLGALNGLILCGGQMPKAAAQDGLFLKSFARLNSSGAPAFGLYVSAILTTLLIWTNVSENTLELFNFAILLSTTSLLVPFVFCSAVAFRLHPTEPGWGRRISFIIFAIAFIFSLWAMGGSGKDALYWGFLLMMVSVPVYIAIRIQTDHRRE